MGATATGAFLPVPARDPGQRHDKAKPLPVSSLAPYLWPLGKTSQLRSPPPPPNPGAARLGRALGSSRRPFSVLTFQTICSAKHSKERAVLSLRRTTFQREPDRQNRRCLKAVGSLETSDPDSEPTRELMGHPQWVSFPGKQKPKEAESILLLLLFPELITSHLGTHASFLQACGP